MKQTVDARGLACPQPVVLTLKAIANAAEVTTIVDNQAAVENVTRLARSKGCTVEVEEKKDGIYLTIKGQGAPAEPTNVPATAVPTSAPPPPPEPEPTRPPPEPEPPRPDPPTPEPPPPTSEPQPDPPDAELPPSETP